MKKSRGLAPLLLCFGAILLIIALVSAFRVTMLGGPARYATGTIVDVRQEQWAGDGSLRYRPVFRFTTAKGEQITVVSHHTQIGNQGPLKVGSNVPVVYDQVSPQLAELGTHSHSHRRAFEIGGTGMALCIVSLIMMRRGFA